MNEEANNYLKRRLALAEPIKLLIIGQDPYPSGATGIAFCKNSFEELFAKNCSGKYVLNSLGLHERNTRRFGDTRELFYYLLEKGIAFINISNKLLEGEFIEGHTKSEFNQRLFRLNEGKILSSRKYNINFIENSTKIVLLGKWKTEPIFKKYYSEFEYNETLIHPSNYNSKSPKATKEWESAYLCSYLLNVFRC